MNIIFDKDNLGLVGKFADHDASPRDYWRLACKIRDRDGFTGQPAVKVMLLEEGARQGDPWSMCELARHYYGNLTSGSDGEAGLPLALSWWQKAAGLGDRGALSDLERLPLEEKISEWQGGGSWYGNLEMRCAMMTEWILTRLGRDRWDGLTFEEQMRRVRKLMDTAAGQLNIRPVTPKVEERLVMADGREAGGLAYINDRKIGLRRQDFQDRHRLIQVLFHELGHFVVYSILRDDAASGTAREQMERFGITPERVDAWKRGDMGIHVVTGEEDPDTLSYGVYTCWLVLFAGK